MQESEEARTLDLHPLLPKATCQDNPNHPDLNPELNRVLDMQNIQEFEDGYFGSEHIGSSASKLNPLLQQVCDFSGRVSQEFKMPDVSMLPEFRSMEDYAKQLMDPQTSANADNLGTTNFLNWQVSSQLKVISVDDHLLPILSNI